jgi:hypothetical protein
MEIPMRRFVLAAFALTALAACSDLMGATVGTYEMVGLRSGNYGNVPPIGGSLRLNETGTYNLSFVWSRVDAPPETVTGSGTWRLHGNDISLTPPWEHWSTLLGTVEPDTVTIFLDASRGGPNAKPMELLFARR